MITQTNLFLSATSPGVVESLIVYRTSMEGEHSVLPENLVRLSIGMENGDDLITDLKQSLNLGEKSYVS
ncbi:MAG: cystathionine gamma-synthase [Planctomycetaceae bacterium]|jgi:cystathionine gamma-synthase